MSIDEVQIRRARPAEFLALAELDSLAWADGWVADGEHVWRVWTEEALTFGAFQGDRCDGAAVAFPGLSGRFFLHKMFVRADFRGQGLGRRLLKAMLDELDSREASVYLTVNPKNESALRLYRGLGFEEKTFEAGYYRPDEDRYLLEREPGRKSV